MIPELRPVDRQGRLLCGWKPAGMGGAECGKQAVWHVAWSLFPVALFSLLCAEHRGDISEWGYATADMHPADAACDMPGTGWSTDWERPGCVAVTTEDVARYRREQR